MTQESRPFETERTRRFRESDLSGIYADTINNVETYGCQCLHVRPTCTDRAHLGFSYTIGIFDTCGKPEVITVGLTVEVAGYLLNEAARRLREGIDLTIGRHRDMIGDVECEFRPVSFRWVKHVMNLAMWYYGENEFPVLQAVYPDLQNRFPEERGFDEAFGQPLLEAHAPQTSVEQDFWAYGDPDRGFIDWKFPDQPHKKVFLSEAVHTGAEPVTFVLHDIEDGGWQFLGDSMTGGEDPVVVCFHHPIDNDRSLGELADLPLGWYAERSGPGEAWVRHRHEPEEEDA